MDDTTSSYPLTSAYPRGRAIKAAALACVHCQRRIHAHDIEVIGDAFRLICAGCGHDLVLVERRVPS